LGEKLRSMVDRAEKTCTGGAPSSASLWARLRSLVPTPSRGPAAVGRADLEDPLTVVPRPLHQPAAHSGASAATVRTLAQAAGSGLPADIGADDAAETVLTKLEAEEHRALADTAASLDVGALTGAADSIVSARRTVVAGIGASGLVAVDLATKLERIGLISR